MKEEDIRPQQLVKKMHNSTMHDVNFLLKRKKQFIKSNCPACNNKKNKKYLKKRGLDYSICVRCKTYFVNPRPTLDILDKFYRQSKVYEYFNKFIFPQTEKERSKKIFLPRVNAIKKICKDRHIKNPSIMDVGAGFGSFLKVAKKSKFFKRTLAIEPSYDGSKNCKKNGVDVIENILENIDPKVIRKFDIITSFEVIEHLYSPINFLNLTKKFLKKNGLLIITCPNGEGFDIQVLKEKSDSIDHEHLNYFNPASIQQLYARAGFKVIQLNTPGKLDVDIVVNKIKKNKIKAIGDFVCEFILNSKDQKVKANFQKFLTKNNLSSNMWLVATKK